MDYRVYDGVCDGFVMGSMIAYTIMCTLCTICFCSCGCGVYDSLNDGPAMVCMRISTIVRTVVSLMVHMIASTMQTVKGTIADAFVDTIVNTAML